MRTDGWRVAGDGGGGDGDERRMFLLAAAAPAAPLQWDIYIVIKESGCEDVRRESEDEECKILRSE